MNIDLEREAFEAWARDHLPGSQERFPNGVYRDWSIECAWQGYQARPAQTEQQPVTPCDHQWTDDGLHLLVCTSCGAQEDHNPDWRDMATAPRDGTMVQLLVEFDENATEDTDGPAPTIGANNFDNDGEDRWQFAGWCWSHDHFTEGKGTPVGWLPIAAPIAQTAPQPEQSGWINAAERVPAEDDGEVLALMDDGTCEIAWASYWHGARTDFAGWTFRDPDEDRTPTHWMPLPAAPALAQPAKETQQ